MSRGFKLDENGDIIVSKTGKITFQDFWEKDGNSPQKVIEYTNGQPYIKRINGKSSKY